MPFNLSNSGRPLSQKMLIGAAILLGIFFGFIFVLLIHTSTINIELPTSKQATIFYDLNNKEFTRIFVENRLAIPLQKMPNELKQAIINVEDNRFYEHSGVDLRAIARAFWVDLKGGGYIEGGSTITQQLARNVLLTQKKALIRKIQEFFLAMSIERKYTKDEILELYLNQIYFGHSAYGVESASRLFFGKSVTDLKLHQIALLVGIPKNPGGYSPYLNPKDAKARRAIVLSQMVKYGSITETEARIYNAKPLDIIPLAPMKRRAAYFIDYIIQKLKGTITEEEIITGGYRIYTTLDPKMQDAAEKAFETFTGGTPDANKVMQPQAALVALDPRNGYIKAMIGGRDFGNTQLNRAVDAYRQAGSSIKPFVYTAAIDSRQFTPSSLIVDEPIKFQVPQGVWAPRNYDGKFRGPIMLRQALEDSVNIVAVKLVESLGPSRVIKYAQKMGLNNLIVSGEPNDLNFSSMALGGLTKGATPLELASAYTPLANQGIYSDPIAILEVKDNDGNTIYDDRPHKKVVIPEDTAYLVTDMMRGVIIRGTGRAAILDRPAAGKTGTSSDYTNAWFVGYTPDLLAAVWIGNDSQKVPVKIGDATIGSGKSAELWGIFMRQALAGSAPLDFVPPPGIVSGIEICTQSGELATAGCPETKFETYLSGTEPGRNCRLHQPGGESDNDPPTTNLFNKPATTPPTVPAAKRKHAAVRICTESGLLATPNCPENQIVTEVFIAGEEPTTYCNVHKR